MAGHPDRVESPTGEYWTAETGTSGVYLQETTDPNPPPVGESVFITHDFADVLIMNGKRYAANFTAENVEYKPEA